MIPPFDLIFDKSSHWLTLTSLRGIHIYDLRNHADIKLNKSVTLEDKYIKIVGIQLQEFEGYDEYQCEIATFDMQLEKIIVMELDRVNIMNDQFVEVEDKHVTLSHEVKTILLAKVHQQMLVLQKEEIYENLTEGEKIGLERIATRDVVSRDTSVITASISNDFTTVLCHVMEDSYVLRENPEYEEARSKHNSPLNKSKRIK